MSEQVATKIPPRPLHVLLYAAAQDITFEQASLQLEAHPDEVGTWKHVANVAEQEVLIAMPVMVTMEQHRQMVGNAVRKYRAEIEGLERAIVNLVLQMGQNAVAPPRIVHLGKVT